MLTTVHRRAAVVAVAALLAGLAGCSRNKVAEQVAAMNTSNMHRLANIYAAFQNFKGGKGPKDEAELKTFIKEYDPEKLHMMGIDPSNLDSVFTSERDGKPFKIRYKVGGGRGSVDAVIFEEQGVDGKKQVGFTGPKIEEVDEATYQKLWSGKREPTAAGPTKDGRPTGIPAGAPTGPPK
jgi:hypothetical protein